MKKEATITVVEDRCDRCNALFSIEHVSDGETLKAKKGSKKFGSFRVQLGTGDDATVLSYEHICETCANKALTMMKAMGKVDRTRGGTKGGTRGSGKGKK
jgi:hypothetical protein